MTGPPWLGDVFAAVMILTAGYCVTRLVISRWRRRPTETDVDAVHVIMGVSMAGMIVPGLRVLPDGIWAAVFAAWAAWFGGRMLRTWTLSRRGPKLGIRPGRWHHGQHLLASLAMLYMLLAARTAAGGGPGAMGMGGSGAGRFPTLALLFTLGLLAYVIWTTDRLGSIATVAALAGDAGDGDARGGVAPGGVAPGGDARGGDEGAATPGGAGGFAVPLSPRLSACCEIGMGVTLGYLLVLML